MKRSSARPAVHHGFTLVEMLIAASIGLVILISIGTFAKETLNMNRNVSRRLNAELSSMSAMRTMARELRSAELIASTSTESIVFFTQVEGQDEPVEVRYFLDLLDMSLKREALGTITALITGVENGTGTPIFGYAPGFVNITIRSQGREYALGASPRNIDKDQ